VFFSLVVARLLTPMMAAYIMQRPTQPHREPSWMPGYLRLARWCLTHRGKTLAITTVFGMAACAPLFMGKIPGAFIPPDDLSQTQVYIQLEPGSTYEQTLAVAEQARKAIADHPHVKMVYTAVGGGAAGSDPFSPSGAPEARKATLTINMTPRKERAGVTKQQVERELRERLDTIPGARLNVGFGGSSEKYVLVLAGEDGEALAAHAATHSPMSLHHAGGERQRPRPLMGDFPPISDSAQGRRLMNLANYSPPHNEQGTSKGARPRTGSYWLSGPNKASPNVPHTRK